MLEEYRRSLKHPGAEEVFDLAFFRPLGWLFVGLVRRTPVTPDQVTILSLAASLAAAWQFAAGGLGGLWIAAAWYALANVLDCADGQLARVRGTGTPHGRIVDGIADYVGTTAVFLGIGAGFTGLGMNLWTETVLAGLSTAIHAAIFDHRQAAFIAAARGDGGVHAGEAETHARRDPDHGGSGVAVAASRLYGGYLRIQHSLMSRFLPPRPRTARPAAPSPEDAALIRLWSFLGPTTNRTALIAFALVGRVDLFLWAVIVPGNLWLAAAWYLQRRVDSRAVGIAGTAGDAGPGGEDGR